MTDAQFDTVMDARLREYAERGVHPIDSRAIARGLVSVRPRRWSFQAPVVFGRRGWLVPAFLLLLLLIAAAGTLAIGAELLRLRLAPRPSTFVFEVGGPTSIPREEYRGTLLADGTVLVLGGATDRQLVSRTAEIFDPKDGTFRPTGTMSVVRFGPGTMRLEDGRILVLGGWQAHGVDAHNTAELFDPGTGQFTSTGAMAAKRQNPTLVRLRDGRILVVGGDSNMQQLLPDATPDLPQTAEVYDPATGQFSTMSDRLNQAMRDFPKSFGSVAASMADGRILVMSQVQPPAQTFPGALLFTPATGEVERLPAIADGDAHEPIASVSDAIGLNDGSVLIVAGWGDGATDSWRLLVYEPEGGKAREIATLSGQPQSRLTRLSDGRLVLVQPDPPDCSRLMVEVVDPVTNGASQFGLPPSYTRCKWFEADATALPDGGAIVLVPGPQPAVLMRPKE